MSNVIMNIRVMPTGVDVDLNELQEKIKEALKGLVSGGLGFKQVPIAFGLKAVDIALVTSEENGTKVEEALKKVENIQSVNVQGVSLV